MPRPITAVKTIATTRPTPTQPALNEIAATRPRARGPTRFSTSLGIAVSPAIAAKPLLTPDNRIRLGPIGLNADAATSSVLPTTYARKTRPGISVVDTRSAATTRASSVAESETAPTYAIAPTAPSPTRQTIAGSNPLPTTSQSPLPRTAEYSG